MHNFAFPTSMAQQPPPMMPGSQNHDPSRFQSHLHGAVPDNLFDMHSAFPSMPDDQGVHNLGLPDLGFPFNESIPQSTSMDPSVPYSFSSTISPPSTAVLSTPFDPTNPDFGFGLAGTSTELINTPLESVSSSNRAYSSRSDSHSDSQPDAKRRRFAQGILESTIKPSLSTFNPDQQMIKLHTRGMFSENMIRVYHDVLEHNLSCWVTEATCPYSGALCRAEGRKTAEWGTAWTNRILDRTMKLDQATKSAGLVKLTRAQEQAVNKAIKMAIMAFATQWAQGTNRTNEQYAPQAGNSPSRDRNANGPFNLADDLDRMAQQHFWGEAAKAMNEVVDIESYVVVCAEIILGFTQRPWMPDDADTTPEHAPDKQSADAFDMDALAAEISRCIEQEGPPVYLERAARKAHALKYRATAAAKGVGKRQGVPKRGIKGSILSREDESTAGLLYWLAVMADTISSSMNERPITVNDEDSQHDLVSEEDREVGRWKVELFIKDNLDKPTMHLSWPCSYEEAAEAVTIAGTVKILMYRHVSYLQGMLRRGQSGKKIEDVITGSLKLWEYWNQTHGEFFRQLVADSDNVPIRVRGWFFCISAHWHLAVLLLIDLLETVDEEDIGFPDDKRRREKTGTVARLRETSLRELSDLGHMSLPPSETDRPPLSMIGDRGYRPDLHHAVSEATILSEPWTMILIRAFSKAGSTFLKQVDNSRQFGERPMFSEEDAMRRAEYCAKTLFYLGRKSDMARRVADLLSEGIATLGPATQHSSAHGSTPAYHAYGAMHGGMNGNLNGNLGANMNDNGSGYGTNNVNGNGSNIGGMSQRDFLGMAMPTA